MRKHGKFREKETNFVSGNLEEHNRCSRRDTGALFGTTEDRRRERKGQRRMGSAREDELGKVRYKPEELGLYIDDPHATLKPELQRCTGPGTSTCLEGKATSKPNREMRGANNNNMAAIQPESPEGKILMKVFDKANSIWEQKQVEVQKEKEIALKKSEAARRGWETRRAKAKAALRIQRMIRCFISKTSVLQEAEQAFTEHMGSKKKEPQIDQNNKPKRDSETTKAPKGIWHTMRDKMSPQQIADFEEREERRVRMIEYWKEEIAVKEAELQIIIRNATKDKMAEIAEVRRFIHAWETRTGVCWTPIFPKHARKVGCSSSSDEEGYWSSSDEDKLEKADSENEITVSTNSDVDQYEEG